MKKSPKQKLSERQVIDLAKDNYNQTAFKIILPKRIKLRPRDILRIQSQLIRAFLKNEIESQRAKDLSYLCANYLSNFQIVELEKKVELLNEKINSIEAK